MFGDMLKFHRKTVLILLAGLMSSQRYCRACQSVEKFTTFISESSINENIIDIIKKNFIRAKKENNNSICVIYNDYSLNRNIPSIDIKHINSFVSNIFNLTDYDNYILKNYPKFDLDDQRKYDFTEFSLEIREYIKNSLLKSFFAVVLGNKIIDLHRIVQILVNREGQFNVIEIDKDNIFYVLKGPLGPNKWTWEFVFHNDFRFQIGGVSLAIGETPLLVGAFPKDEAEIKKIFSKFPNKRRYNPQLITDVKKKFVTVGNIFQHISKIEGIEYVVNDSLSKYKVQVIDMEKARISDIKNSIIKLFGIEIIQSPDKKKMFVSYKRLKQINIDNAKNAIRNYLPPQIERFYRDKNLNYRKIKNIKDDVPDRDSSMKAVAEMFDCVRDEVINGLDNIRKDKKTIPLKEIEDDLLSKISLLFLCTVDIVVRGMGIGFPDWANRIDECKFEKISEENKIMSLGIHYKNNLVHVLKLKMP